MIVADGKTLPKPKPQWTKDEKHAFNCNNKTMNGIYNGVSAEEFCMISTCKIAKEAWEVLQTVYEVQTRKQSKVHGLTKEFKTIMLEEYETFY